MTEGGGNRQAQVAAVESVGEPPPNDGSGAGETVPPKAKPERDAWLPGWLVAHPLYAGWAWTVVWAGLIVLDEVVDLAGWTWYLLVLVAALPTLISTLVVLHATPRSHLRQSTQPSWATSSSGSLHWWQPSWCGQPQW